MPNLVNVTSDFPFDSQLVDAGITLTKNYMYIEEALCYGIPPADDTTEEVHNEVELTPEQRLLPLAEQAAIIAAIQAAWYATDSAVAYFKKYYKPEYVKNVSRKVSKESSKYALKEVAKRSSTNAAGATIGSRIISCVSTALTVATVSLQLYIYIQCQLEMAEARKLLDYDMKKLNPICEVNETNFLFQANYKGTSSNFSLNYVRFEFGLTNQTLYTTAIRSPTTVFYEMQQALMLWAPQVDDIIEFEYTKFKPLIDWNLFDQFIVAKLSINWSDMHQGQLQNIPINGNLAASSFAFFPSPVISATIQNIFYDDATTITLFIKNGKDNSSLGYQYPVNNFSYYVGSLTDTYFEPTTIEDALGRKYTFLDTTKPYEGSRDIDIADIEQFTQYTSDGIFTSSTQMTPFYLYNIITPYNEKFKVRLSKMFAGYQRTTSFPNKIQTFANIYKTQNNISCLSERGDMTQFNLLDTYDPRINVARRIPDGQVGVIMKNLLSVNDSLEYLGNDVFKFTMRNVTAPFNFKYGFNKLLEPSVNNPSIILAPWNLTTPNINFTINPPNTSYPSISITLSPSLPVGILGKTVGYSIQVLKGLTDVTNKVSPSVTGSVYTYQNMKNDVTYTFVASAWAYSSDGKQRKSNPVLIGPFVLKSLQVPSFTNTTFTSVDGVITINSNVPSYEGIDSYKVTCGNDVQSYAYTSSPIVIQAPSIFPPTYCTVQTKFKGFVSDPLPIKYSINSNSLFSIRNWWTTGAYYHVACSCPDLEYLDRVVVYSIGLADEGENISFFYNKKKLDVCFSRIGGARITVTDENLYLSVAMFLDNAFTTLLTNQNFVLKDTSANILSKLRLLDSPLIKNIVLVDTLILDASTYLEQVGSVNTFPTWLSNLLLKCSNYVLNVSAATIGLNFSGLSVSLFDTAENIQTLNLSNYDALVSIAATSLLNYSWPDFNVTCVNKYKTRVLVKNVPLSSAHILQTNSNIKMQIIDEAANYVSIMNTLSSNGIEKIDLSGALNITYSQFATSTTMSLLTKNFSVTQATCNDVLTNQFLAALKHVEITVEDSSANVVSLLNLNYSTWSAIRYIYANGEPTIPYYVYVNLFTSIENMGNAAPNRFWKTEFMTPFHVSKCPTIEARYLQSILAEEFVANNHHWGDMVATFTVYDASYYIGGVDLKGLLSRSKISSITGFTPVQAVYFEGLTQSNFLKLKNCEKLSAPVSSINTVNAWFTKSTTILQILDTAENISANIESICASNATSIDLLDRTKYISVKLANFLAKKYLYTVSTAIVDASCSALSLSDLNGYDFKFIELGVVDLNYTDILTYAYLVSLIKTKFTVSNVPCYAILSLLSDARCQSITVVDSATRILQYLPILQSSVSKISRVTSNSGVINPMVRQFVSPNPKTPNVNTIFQKMQYQNPNAITCSSIQDFVKSRTPIILADNVTNILNNLSNLKTASSLLISVSATKSIPFTREQVLDNPKLLTVLQSDFTISNVPVYAMNDLLASNQNLKSIEIVDSGANIDKLTSTSRVSSIEASSGTIKFASFNSFASLLQPVSILDTVDVIKSNLSVLNANFLKITSIQCREPLFFDGTILNYLNIVPLFSFFTLSETYSFVFANASVIVNGNVKNVQITDSISVDQFNELDNLPLANVAIQDSAVNVQSWLESFPPASVIAIQPTETVLIPFSYLNNTSLLQSAFHVSNVPCASVVSTLAVENVSSIYVVDTASQISAFRSILDENRSRIISEIVSDSNNVEMTVAEFLNYVSASPTYKVVVVDSANVVGQAISVLDESIDYIQSILRANITVADITTFNETVHKLTSFTLHDTADTIVSNLKTINNYPITSIVADSGSIVLNVSQLCDAVKAMQTFQLSDTGSNLQALALTGFAPYATSCSRITVSAGTVTLSFSQFGSFVGKMSERSVTLVDDGAAITSFTKLASYTTQIFDAIILGSISIDFQEYNAFVAAKFKNFFVSNVPVRQVATVLTSPLIYITVIDTGEELSNIELLSSSKIQSITKTTGTITLSVANFINNLNILQTNKSLKPVIISDTSNQITANLSTLNKRANFIQSVNTTGLSLTYAEAQSYPALTALLQTPFTITKLSCAQIPSALGTYPIGQISVSDTLTNIINDMNGAGLLTRYNSSISVIKVFKDATAYLPYSSFVSHKTVFDKFSFV
jgi:hypothetical protein